MPRKSVIMNPITYDTFIQAIKLGMTDRRACEYANIDASTFYNLLNRAKRDEDLGLTAEKSIYISFFNAVKRARSQFQYKHLAQIDAVSATTWQASAWLLERIFPDEFGLKNDVNITNDKIVIVADLPKKEDIE